MVKLINANHTRFGSVQIADKDLENFAYNQLRDFQKNYFKSPHPLDIDYFVELYLEKKVQYYQLSTKDSKNRLLGTTAISDGKIAIINEEGHPEIKVFKQGTIIIDEEACEKETRRRFTLGHEAWHSQFDLQLDYDLLDNDNLITDTNLIIGSSFKKVNSKTPKDLIEYHADLYAVYLLMPKVFVNKLFVKYHKQFFGKERRLTCKKPKRTWLLIRAIANELSVSMTAVAYRLKELNKISNEILISLRINEKKEDTEMI